MAKIKSINKISLLIMVGTLVILSQFVNCGAPLDQGLPTGDRYLGTQCDPEFEDCDSIQMSVQFAAGNRVVAQMVNDSGAGLTPENIVYQLEIGGVCNDAGVTDHKIAWELRDQSVDGNGNSTNRWTNSTILNDASACATPRDFSTRCEKGIFRLIIPFVFCSTLDRQTHSLYAQSTSGGYVDGLTANGVAANYDLEVSMYHLQDGKYIKATGLGALDIIHDVETFYVGMPP